MNATGRRLGEVQYQGHVAIDRAYGPLSIAIAEVVMRYATPDQHGILRLTLPARALILNEVGRLLDETRGKLLPVILASIQAAREAAQEDTEPIPVPVTEQIETISTVSRALNTDRQSVLDQTGALLLAGIVARQAASMIAKRVKEYFYKRDPATGLVQMWPGRTNMASQHARLVMLTETTRSHSEAMIRTALRDGSYLKWNLSSAHAHSDVCDSKARADLGYGRGVYPANQVPPIPTHPRCFPAGVMVSGPKAIASTERWYEGDLVHIVTAGGLQLPVTPNHPILTPQGWVAAGLLQEGDDVVCDCFSQGVAIQVHPHEQQIPALIEDVARSLGGALSMSTVRMPTTTVDFHGDGMDREVCVVRTDGLLDSRLNATVSQPSLNQQLAGAGVELFDFPRDRSLAPHFEAVGLPPLGSVSGLRVCKVLFGAALSNHELVGFRDTPNHHSRVNEALSDGSATYPERDSQAVFGLSGQISGGDVWERTGVDAPALAGKTPARAQHPATSEFVTHALRADAGAPTARRKVDAGFIEEDRIIKIERRKFAGHVYNLETGTGWYRANGIIVHNCRCYLSSVRAP